MVKKLKHLYPIKVKRKARTKLFAEDLVGEKTHTTTFRPQDDLMEDYCTIRQWCQDNASSFSSIINSFLPAIAYTLNNAVFEDRDTSRRYMRCDFGDVLLREPHLPNQ